MKLAKLSLAAIVVAGLASSSFAADNLADAFKNGKVQGTLKAWYYDRDLGTAATNANIINTGMELGYITDSLYGFSMGATFQANAAPFADKEAKTTFKGDQYGSGAVLSEAYLAYKMKNTTVKVGRQYISTPLVNGSFGRMTKEAFEAATIVNTDLPATTLIAAYVSKFQGRTSTASVKGDFNAPSFVKKAVFTVGQKNGKSLTALFDGAYTIAAINKSIPNLTLTAQYAKVNDVDSGTAVADADLYYGEANYVLPMSGFKLGFDAAYRGSKTGSALDTLNLEGNMLTARVALIDLAGFGASLAYGTTSNSDGVIAGMGNGPTSYTATLIRAATPTFLADTDSYKFEITYDFAKVGVAGLKALAAYGYADQNSIKTELKSYAGALMYAVPAVKGLSFAAQYETQEVEVAAKSVDQDEFRFMANYKF